MRSFASDNAAGVDAAVMDALVAANIDHALAYGSDPWTARVTERFRELFGAPVEVCLVWGGTGANVVALQSLLSPWDAVVCSEQAHIAVDECGAPERFTGAKLLSFRTVDGKLTPEQITASQVGRGDEHHSQATVVSITQSTECGTLYTPDEIKALTEVAHALGMKVHLDGARIANAVAALGCDVRAVTIDAGIDVVSFGGTKNGMMYGEAVVYLDPALGTNARFIRKQATQLPSKMRFVAAQFEALLAEGRWLANAGHANAMAVRLADAVRDIPGVDLTREPVVNSVFARLPPAAIPRLQERSFFWMWD
ncbi:MAG: aminotransferase class V-fold PLP-dependent enzyme, partial [Acidimicrobiia bacterium]|nr:aminotransferase class V-fold PLP-dependent enzyme [Acidimicrobiia bacterium]